MQKRNGESTSKRESRTWKGKAWERPSHERTPDFPKSKIIIWEPSERISSICKGVGDENYDCFGTITNL